MLEGILRNPTGRQVKIYSASLNVKANCGWEAIKIGTKDDIVTKCVREQNTLQLLLHRVNIHDIRYGDSIDGTRL